MDSILPERNRRNGFHLNRQNGNGLFAWAYIILFCVSVSIIFVSRESYADILDHQSDQRLAGESQSLLIAASKTKRKKKKQKRAKATSTDHPISGSSSEESLGQDSSANSTVAEEDQTLDESKTQVFSLAGLAGIVMVSGADLGTPIAFGLDGFYLVTQSVEVGGSLLYWQASSGAVTLTGTIFDVGAHFYFMPGKFRPYLGGSFGQTSLSGSTSTGAGGTFTQKISAMHIYLPIGLKASFGATGKYFAGAEIRLPLYFDNSDEGYKGAQYFLAKFGMSL